MREELDEYPHTGRFVASADDGVSCRSIRIAMGRTIVV